MSSESAVRRAYRFFNPLQEGFDLRSPWIEYTARVGYLAIGIVYGLVGILAFRAATTAVRSPDTSDALDSIRLAPFGRVLLGAVAIGLLAYAIWRFVQAWSDTEGKGNDVKGLFIRAGYAISGVIYVGLAAAAGAAALRGGSIGGDSNRQQLAAGVLAWPGGWVVLLVTGLIVIGVGIAHFVNAYRANFMRDYEHVEMSHEEREFLRPVGRFGLTARGLTFCLIGLFLAMAGWRANAGEVGGLGDAFTTVAAQPYGQVLLAVVAIGFMAYGVYAISCAKYRRIAKN